MKYFGYTDTDPDDELESAIINVNEPVVIRDICIVDGQTFYYVQSNNCNGWTNASKLAIFDSKEEWINAWKVDIDADNFLVVTQDKITLEPSLSCPETSEVKLHIGTVLKLVPDNELPNNLGERGTWNNYVVYLPTRDENGKYVKSYALISEHYSVSVGFLQMTQENILNVAFSCLGNRYGWGGMLGAMDCSLYTRAIYECFGLELPRNTTWQQKVPGKVTDISDMTDAEKQEYLEKIPAGSTLYFPGHTMVYVGNKDGKSFVISATGSISDSSGTLNVRSMYSIILNPLTTRRSNGRTWLNSLSAVLTFGTSKEKTIESKGTQINIAEYLFDSDLYYSLYPDLQKAFGHNTQALRNHYFTYGIKEGRIASYMFDPVYYLDHYSDLKDAFGKHYEDALNHFVYCGIHEGRIASSFFDVQYYLDKYEDLENNFGSNYSRALEHFYICGIKEGRIASKEFNVKNYRDRYDDLKNAFNTDWKLYYKHYLLLGKKENRNAL